MPQSIRLENPTDSVDAAANAIENRARPVEEGLDDLVDRCADADVVLLGEASHGTSEYYRLRARLTARLIAEGDASFVAVEGDWTDCFEISEYVTGRSETDSAREVLEAFERWPTWMWANWEVLEFVEWLAEHNATTGDDVGFYGLDVYSLFESMAAVIDYLGDIDPETVARARDAYRCFEPYGEDPREYSRSLRLVPESCEDEVVGVLTSLRERVADSRPGGADESEDGDEDALERFAAERNAAVAKNAEAYYRAMARGNEDSWNVRDRHMAETLDELLAFHDGPGIVWAHNTHVGDARATDMGDRGKLNLGQLARERYGSEDVAVVGFGSHRGTVIAADRWGGSMAVKTVPTARRGSHEDAFHRAVGDGVVFLEDAPSALREPRGHRAIGVTYSPAYEGGNYVPTVLPDRYDAFVYLAETEALHPLHAEDGDVPPETYPWGV